MAISTPHRQLGSAIAVLTVALAGLTAACSENSTSVLASTSTTSTTAPSSEDIRLASGLVDAATVRTLIDDPTLSVSSPPLFRLADVHDTYASCDNGLHGAFTWLATTRQLVGIEISTNSRQPEKPVDVLNILAAAPPDLHVDPRSAIVRSMRQCGANVDEINLAVNGRTIQAVRVPGGVNQKLTGYIVSESIKGYVAIAAAAHVQAGANDEPSQLDKAAIDAALSKVHKVLD